MKRRILLVVFFLVSVLFLGCGKKSPPLTISESTPSSPKLKASATEVGILLEIELPKRNKAGYTLYSLKKVIIQKKCGENEETIEVLPKCHPFARILTYLDSEVESGECCEYRVSVEKNMFVRSPFSKWKRVCWHAPLLPPKNLSIQVIKDLGILRLTWIPVKVDVYNSTITTNLLFLLEELSSNASKKVILKKPQFQTEIPKKLKCYRVKSLFYYENTLIPGFFTPIVCVNQTGALSPQNTK
ncbi:MAG: hypothetical protein GXO57_02020 [Thermodesulfobacteria bacterium]|nr:hypothetical protein [Thermodesulfobacteriota bacterium]